MEKDCNNLDEPKKNNFGEIEVLNYSDGEAIDYPFVLLECQFKSDTNFNGKSKESELSLPRDDNTLINNSQKLVQVLVETHDKCRSWPVIREAFKILVKLVPGDNNLRIKAYTSKKNLIQKDFNLVYKPSTLPRFVRVVYVKCVDSDGSFEAAPGVANNVKSAQKKLAFNARLLQTFTAQDLHKHGFGHRTFRLEENSEGDPVIHVFTSSLTTKEALKMNGGELYSQFSKELSDSSLYDPLCKFWTFMSCTHYDPPPPEEFDEKDIHLYVKAHTALGGGNLALFGTGGLHTWADNVDDLIACFTNSKKIDRRSLFDDSCKRGFYWANYATGLGASMHELGHCFDLAHTPKGIMGRGFDDFNCVFTLWRNPPELSADKEKNPGLAQLATENEPASLAITDIAMTSDQSPENSKDDHKSLAVLDERLLGDSECCSLALPGNNSHGATWYRSSAVLLRYHKWFSASKETEEEVKKLPLIHWGRQFYGPMGTLSGNANSRVFFNDKAWLSKNNARFSGYVVHADVYVNCIQTVGVVVDEQDGVESVGEVLSEPRGREGVGRRYIFRLEHPDEHVIAVDLRSGTWIDALRFHTNYKSSLWMGGKGGSLCHFEPSQGQSMVGVFGCAGNYVGSLGFFQESPQSSSSSLSDPQDNEELVIEAPNGLRLIELQSKTHGEVCKHWEFLDVFPPTRFCLDRDDIMKQEATIMIEDDLGNIQKSGPFYDFDKMSATEDDSDNVLVVNEKEGESSFKEDDSTKQEENAIETKDESEN